MKKHTFAIGAIFLAVAFASQASAQTVTSAQTANFLTTGDLAVGSRGAMVAELQGLLLELGHLTVPRGTVLGYYGPLTSAAVARYQASLNITANGRFDATTRTALADWLRSRNWVSIQNGMYYWGTATNTSTAQQVRQTQGNVSTTSQIPAGSTGYWHQGSWYASLPGTSGTSTANGGITGYWLNNTFYSYDGTSSTVYGTPDPTSNTGGTGYWYNGVWTPRTETSSGYGFYSTR